MKTRQPIPQTWQALALILISSCAQVDPKPDYDKARQLIEASTGRSEVFDPYASTMDTEELDAIFIDGLTLDEALRLALLNNRDLQAEFQEIGIANADWIQSRLLTNPSLDLLLRSPANGGRAMLEAILSFELLELWRVPLRKESGRHQLEATVLRVARRAGELLAETREAYYAAVAAKELQLVTEENVELVTRSFSAIESLHAAGAADAFDESLARGPLLAAQLALQAAHIKSSNTRRDLAKKLSTTRPFDDLLLTDSLPLPTTTSIDADALVQEALASRLDLQAIEEAIRALDTKVRLEERKAWGDIAAGPSVERPTGSGSTLIGPSLSLTLPIFDQNQAQVARAGFKLQQMVMLHEAAKVAVTQDVRAGVVRMNTTSSSLDFYEKQLLPQTERSHALVEDSYAGGRASLLELLEVQRQVLEARRAHVNLRLEAAVSSSDLERLVGVPLDKAAGE
ncbi:MAG: cobalt-zinc-cadmium efflux system outer membrane protein [Planctomycetota bacterium]|jgi:cobalt-zinc-cadmium efflux system outer membrane protein